MVVPKSLTKIKDFTFQWCHLNTVNFGNATNITYIGCGAFYDNENLTALYGLDKLNSLTTIGNPTLSTMGDTYRAYRPFGNCKELTGDLHLPNSLTYICAYAFGEGTDEDAKCTFNNIYLNWTASSLTRIQNIVTSSTNGNDNLGFSWWPNLAENGKLYVVAGTKDDFYSKFNNRLFPTEWLTAKKTDDSTLPNSIRWVGGDIPTPSDLNVVAQKTFNYDFSDLKNEIYYYVDGSKKDLVDPSNLTFRIEAEDGTNLLDYGFAFNPETLQLSIYSSKTWSGNVRIVAIDSKYGYSVATNYFNVSITPNENTSNTIIWIIVGVCICAIAIGSGLGIFFGVRNKKKNKK